MNKDTEFVMCVDDFLSPQSLFLLQNEMMEITEYKNAKDSLGRVFGWRYHYDSDFNEKHNGLLDDIKHFFFPYRDLVPMQVSANIRSQNSVAKKGQPLFHRDTYGDNVANFMLYVKGEPLINNGTGFLHDTETGWLDIKDVVDAPLAVCQEVGWMVHNGPEKIIIMRSYSKDKDEVSGGGAIAIPKGWIKKIEYLKVDYVQT